MAEDGSRSRGGARRKGQRRPDGRSRGKEGSDRRGPKGGSGQRRPERGGSGKGGPGKGGPERGGPGKGGPERGGPEKRRPERGGSGKGGPERGGPEKRRQERGGSAARRSGPGGEVEGVPEAVRYEAQVLPGLAPYAARELEGVGARLIGVREDEVAFEFAGSRDALHRLRLSVAVFEVLAFAVPRPRGLLGHEHLTKLLAAIESLLSGPPQLNFNGFRLAAAGSDSPVFSRLAEAVAAGSGLAHDAEEGELVIRVRPGVGGSWEVLLRLTPRPLATRQWRVCNRPGGLNATVAAAMNDMLRGGTRQRYLNLMCGSGTLLVERLLAGKAASAVGVDIDEEALACAGENVRSAGVEERCRLLRADVRDLPLAKRTFDAITADLPWGDAVGEHRSNPDLYRAFLAESARVAAAGARLVAVTHELRVFEDALANQREWRQKESFRVFHGGHRPTVYLLDRS